MVPSQVSELLEHVTWALPEGGREGWNKRRIGSEAWFTIQRQQLRSFAIMRGIVNVLRSTQVAHANKFNTSVPH